MKLNTLLDCVENSQITINGSWRSLSVHRTVIFTGEGSITIGDNVQIKSGAVIYGGTDIGDDTIIGHNAVIEHDCQLGRGVFIGNGCTLRPETVVGNECTLGHLSVVEGCTTIGNGSLIHAQCHITKGVTIGNNVFIAPLFVGANDPVMQHRRCMVFGKFKPTGYRIGDNARIGISVSVLPGVSIGSNAVIGAGSLVTCDIPAGQVWMGSPASYRRDVPPEEYLID